MALAGQSAQTRQPGKPAQPGEARQAEEARKPAPWHMVTGTVRSNRPAGSGYYRLIVHAKPVAAACRPGQFVMLRAPEWGALVFSRPFDVYRSDPESGTVEILFKLKGEGTRRLAALVEGEQVRVLGPLGRPVPLPDDGRGVILVARGAGVSPMVRIAQECAARGVAARALVSAARPDRLMGVDDLRALGVDVHVTTDDDGAAPAPAAVLGRWAKEGRWHGMFVCGSRRLARAARWACREYGLSGYVFVEATMACGFGICHGCAVPINDGGGSRPYALACVDGPALPIETATIE
ncbi:MAG: hypothetical protein H0Z37_01715 [Firmicutes bacterium]|nr:hypothetical protein [Bacillota bacterium]